MNANITSMNRWNWRRAGLLAVGAALAACSTSNGGKEVETSEVSPNIPAVSTHASKDPRVEEWQKVIRKTPPPKDGCFRTSYPSTTWTEVPCIPVPPGPASTPHPPTASTEARGSGALSLEGRGGGDLPGQGGGSGTDWFLHESAPILQATGSFTEVTGATSPNSYSVQLNSNSFALTSTADSLLGAICPSGSCTVWQQVLYSTTAARTGVYFQYWVLSGGNGMGEPTGCAALELFGWTPGPGSGSCFLNSKSVSGVPLVPIADLSTISVNVVASSSDVLTMTIEGLAYSASFASELGLNQGSWNQVEYGVFGDLGGRGLTLSPDTTIATQILAASSTGTASCTLNVPGGATGETNNLFDPTTAGGGPANCCLALNGGESGITFTETNTPGQACTVCGGVGQSCCSDSTPSWCAPGEICYSATCEPCGGSGELCCATATPCSTAGDVCQNGDCGLPNTLTASPSSISLAAADGAGLSVNHATTSLTASGAWAGGTAPSFSFSGMPAGVTCAASNDIAPSSGPSTVTCTSSPTTPLGTYTIAITATIGPYNPMTTDVTLTVTACKPLTCSGIGYVCGSLDTGCGTTLNCGTCSSGETCAAGACHSCVERTCPVSEVFNLSLCECEAKACPCGTILVNGHDICNVCKP